MGSWVEGVTPNLRESSEIMNSWNLFNYSSGVVPRTIQFLAPVMLYLGGSKIEFQHG